MNRFRKQLLSKCIPLRNWLDYFLYGNKIGYIDLRMILVDIVILIYSLCNLEALQQTKSLLTLLLLIFTTFIWQVICIGRNYYQYTKKTAYYNLHSISASKPFNVADEVKHIYTDQPLKFRDTELLFSSAINTLLQADTPIHPKLCNDKQKHVEEYIKSYRDTLLPFLNYLWHKMKNKRGSFYNETKLCMASEFGTSATDWYVRICKGNYYNSCLTNFIYTQRLSHQSSWSMQPPANIENYPIRKLDKSVMSDHIGVSTLAITSDGYVLILRHNDKALTATDQLTPSGSGSVDYVDLQLNADFRQTLRYAAERELHEETGIAKAQMEKTTIIGFYRDLKRGGKPEFCCVTYLKCNYLEVTDTLKPDSNEQQEYCEEFQILGATGQLDGEQFGKFTELILSENPHSENTPSLSLYMCYMMLCLYYGHSTKN